MRSFKFLLICTQTDIRFLFPCISPLISLFLIKTDGWELNVPPIKDSSVFARMEPLCGVLVVEELYELLLPGAGFRDNIKVAMQTYDTFLRKFVWNINFGLGFRNQIVKGTAY